MLQKQLQLVLHLSRAIVALAGRPSPALADATNRLLHQLVCLISCLHVSVHRLLPSSEATSFARQLRSQLTESGLLRQLPQLASDATAQLVADQQQQQQQQHQQQPQATDRKQVETRALWLSSLYGELMSQWANDTSPIWTDMQLWQDTSAGSIASALPAGFCLAVAALQYVSTQLQQLQRRQPSSNHASRLSDLASFSLEFLGGTFIVMSGALTHNNQLMRAAAWLLRDACCVPAMALVCATVVQLQHLEGSKHLGGSSRTAQQQPEQSEEDGDDNSARVWRQVCSSQCARDVRLPAGICEQLQTALGVSGVGLARAAGVLAARSPNICERLTMPLGLFGVLRLYRAVPVAALESHAAAEVHQHLLLALLMTAPCPPPAATSSSRGSASSSSSRAAAAPLVPCRVGAGGSSRALKAWLHTAKRAGPQYSLQLLPAQALMSGVELLLTDVLQQLTQGSEVAALTASSVDGPAAQLTTSGPLLGHAAASAVAMLQCVVGFLQLPSSRDTQAAVQEAWAAAAPRLARLLEGVMRFEGRNAALLTATQGEADSCYCLPLLGSLIVPRRLEPVVDPMPQPIGGAGSGLLLVPRGLEGPQSDWGLLLEAAVAAGPGSAQQQQLLGLLTTGLKLQRVVLQAGGSCLDPSDFENSFFYRQVSSSALRVLQAWGNTFKGSAPAAAAGTAAADVDSMLPWLALLGRCCLANAEAITVAGGEDEAAVDRLIGKSSQRLPGVTSAVDAIASMLLPLTPTTHGHVFGGGHAAARVLLPRLASLGVDVAALRQHAADARDAAATAHSMMVSAGSNVMVRGLSLGQRPLRRLLKVLQPGSKLPAALEALGAALGAAPCRASCNAPRCASLASSTEQQLVKGTGKVCSACHTVRYCCKPCQRAHWRSHKPVCRALQAEAAGTAASSEPADDGGVGSSVGAPA
jgi:hypothetical protein